MCERSIFYVYEHWRPDTNSCFYVGKGSGRRAWRIGVERNQHYLRVKNKLESIGLMIEIRLISENLTSKEACIQERARIAFYGMEALTNKTAGGEGLLSPTAETRAKMSAAVQRRLADPEFRRKHAEATRIGYIKNNCAQKVGLANLGRKQSPEANAKRSAAMRGRKFPDKGMRGERNPFFGKKHSPEIMEMIRLKKVGLTMSPETRAKMRLAQSVRRENEARLKPPPQPEPIYYPYIPRKKHVHSQETRERLRAIAKLRVIPESVRIAQRAAVTDRKRAPFTPETIAKMRLAAAAREAAKKKAYEIFSDMQLRLEDA